MHHSSETPDLSNNSEAVSAKSQKEKAVWSSPKLRDLGDVAQVTKASPGGVGGDGGFPGQS